MSNFEHRITENSTEFEKAFLKIYDGNLWTALDKMKDWQPPKPLVKIPQFMADWFEYQLKNNNDLDKFDGNDVFRIIQDVIKVSNDESTWEDYGITDEISKFAEDNEELFLDLIVNCSLGNGYTVEKPQLFYLNNKIKLEDVGSDLIGYLNLFLTNNGYLTSNINRAKKFTQQEIDSMETGIYDKIEVEP